MSIAEQVRIYIKNKPYVKESLEKGIANLSALSRQIQGELDIESFEAVKAALRRLSEDMKKRKHKREEKVLKVLRDSKITIYDGDVALITKEPIEVNEKFKVNLGQNYFYLIEKGEILKGKIDFIRKKDNCTTILIESPDSVEEVPGVVAYITSLLAEQGVNIYEFISCWKYTIIVVKREDSLRAYDGLSGVVG